jgi:hypothetical protein
MLPQAIRAQPCRPPAPHPPPLPPPLVPPPPSTMTVGMPPPPLLPRPSPLLLAIGQAMPWSASSPPAPPVTLKVVGSQFAGSTIGSGSPSAGSAVASCSHRRAAPCHGRVGCAAFSRWWTLDVACTPLDPAAPSRSRRDPPPPSLTSPPPPPAGHHVVGGSCLTVHGPKHRCRACWWPTPMRPSPRRLHSDGD